MKLLNFIVLVMFFNNSSSLISRISEKSSVKLISQAISDIIREFYIINNIKFEIIIYGDISNHINDVIDLIKISKTPTTIKHILDIKNWSHEMETSAIIFIKSKKSLNNFQLNCIKFARIKMNPQLTNKSYKILKFMVYVEEMSFSELRKTYTAVKPAKLFFAADLKYYEFFITYHRGQIDLSAYQLFSSTHCGFFKPILLNSFDIVIQKWHFKLQNFDHYKNFYGCMLQISAKLDNTLYMEGENEDDKRNFDLYKLVFDKNTKFGGLTNELMQVMSKRNNFTFCYTIMTSYKDQGSFLGTKNFYGYDIYNIFLENLVYKVSIVEDYTLPYNGLEHYYLLSLNDLYTNYEKLSMPFDFLTWVLLIFTFGLTFGIIFGLRFCRKWIQIIFFGQGNSQPGYNALGIFFGITQLKLPEETFNRISLLLFIWFCLIFRTCWQSKMFEFMTNNMRKSLPESIEDLKEMNYTILVFESDEKYLIFNNEIINARESPKIELAAESKFKLAYKKALDDALEKKIAFFVNTEIHAYLNSTFKQSLPAMVNERLAKMIGFELPKNNILVGELNHVISRLLPSGIANYLSNYGWWYLYRPIEVLPEDPRRILSMSDLEFGFVIFLSVLSLSIFVFICELFSLFVRRQLRKLLGLYEFFKVLRERLKDYHDKW